GAPAAVRMLRLDQPVDTLLHERIERRRRDGLRGRRDLGHVVGRAVRRQAHRYCRQELHLPTLLPMGTSGAPLPRWPARLRTLWTQLRARRLRYSLTGIDTQTPGRVPPDDRSAGAVSRAGPADARAAA